MAKRKPTPTTSAIVIPFPAARIKRRPPASADDAAFSNGLMVGLQMAKDFARRGLLRTDR